MISFNVYTDEIDFLEESMEEIKQQFEGKVKEIGGLRKNTAAIIFADCDTDIQELMERLTEIYDFPMISSSVLGSFDNDHGYVDTGISMLVLTTDDIEFGIAISEEIGENDIDEKVKCAYDKAKAQLSEKPALIISYGVMLASYTGDDIVAAIDKASGGVPLYGGQASDDFAFTKAFVAANGTSRKQGVAMLVMAGEGLKNVYAAYEFSIIDGGVFEGVVTKCSGNTISEVDGVSFLESLEKLRIVNGQEGVVQMQYITSPFLFTETKENGDEVYTLRNLTVINRKEGTVSFLGKIKEGSKISMVVTNRDTVALSMRNAFNRLITKMQKENREWSTFLCTSCMARYLNLGVGKDEEVKGYQGKLGENTAILGMYSSGEYYPQNFQKEEEVYNVFFNETITILVL